MADTKISDLTAITGVNTAADDDFVIVDTSAAQTKRITRDELRVGLYPGIDDNSSATAVTIDASGHVGINEASPTADLHVDGDMILDAAHPSSASSIGIGTSALEDSTALAATAVGVSALKQNTTGARNTAVGNLALRDNTDASNSTAVGYNSLAVNNGAQNQAFGAFTLDANTTGIYNTAVGYASLGANVSGNYNVAVGARNILTSCVSGLGNVAVGGNATMTNLDDGDYNIGIGYSAGQDIEGGSHNVLVGRSAGLNIVDSDSNVCVGYLAGNDLISGAENTCVGINSGNTLTTGSSNTLLGRYATPSAVDVSNEITLGDANVATLRCQQTSISALSDARDKDEIQDLRLGLDYIQQVRPVEFVWQMRDGAVTDKKDFGFIAQEMMAVEDANDAEWVSSVLRTNPERLEVAPAQLLPIAVKAIQELSAQLDELKAKVDSCKCRKGK
tara:strand:- start:46 stop:1389 length:1344 start_codon:yes stop_codon:yes gene_type:complete